MGFGRKPSRPSHPDPKDYRAFWRWRAQTYGSAAVMNLSHPRKDYEKVAQRYREYLEPILAAEVKPTDRILVDFGCGSGRFITDLESNSQGVVLGLDPSPELLQMAPWGERIHYLCADHLHLPLLPGTVDFLFVSLVLGGLEDNQMDIAKSTLSKCLRPGGTLFLIENTAESASPAHWTYRSQGFYHGLFSEFNLVTKHSFRDLGDQVTLFFGKKPQAPSAEGSKSK